MEGKPGGTRPRGTRPTEQGSTCSKPGSATGHTLVKNGMKMLIPDNHPKGSMLKPKEHVSKAKALEHPFQAPPDLPLDLQFAANASIPDITSVRALRMQKAQRLSELADKADAIDRNKWN